MPADPKPSELITEAPINTTVQIGKPNLTYATVTYGNPKPNANS